MKVIGVAGFFGKLPSAGDFVQRRLPAVFVERWDAHFQQAIAESRNAFGSDWLGAYCNSPVWHFVMAPGLCGRQAWAGVVGPATDRVGRAFPMVICAELAASFSACGEALQRPGWFANAAAVLRSAQRDSGETIEAFDAHVAAIGTAVAEDGTDAADLIDQIDLGAAAHWRIPLPSALSLSSKHLCRVWSQLGAEGVCLWWTEGGAWVAPSVLVTKGLPSPAAYVGFLDSACSGAWRTLGVFAHAWIQESPAMALAAHAPTAVGVASVSEPAPIDNGFKRTALPPAAAERASSEVSMAPAPPAVEIASVPAMNRRPYVAVMYREDCALTMVAADSGGHDPQQRAALSIFACARQLHPNELLTGLQPLRDRLLALHSNWLSTADDLINPSGHDCAVVAIRISDGRGSLLKVGAASAWCLRHGHLQELFVPRQAGLVSDGGDLDDLLFSAGPTSIRGLGASGTPDWQEASCAVQRGDRLLLAATRRLVQLSPDVLMRALMMRTRDEISTRLANAAMLPSDTDGWPFAVIDVG